MADTIVVEVAYAEPHRQFLRKVEIAAGATVGEAIRASGIQTQLADLDIANANVGVFGQLACAATVLRDGDRVEIYRPLKADPKEARRRRAARTR